MLSAREIALWTYNELEKNKDVNTNDGMLNPHPQIVTRIVDVIELGILRHMEEYLKDIICKR